MKILKCSIVLIVAMMTIGCTKEAVSDQKGDNIEGVNKSFTASFEEAATKALLKPGKDVSKVEWETTDQVSVFDGTSNVLYQAGEAGETTQLTTEGTLAEAETYYALYPYNEAATIDAGVITTALPYEQTAELNTFSTHLTVAQTAGDNFSFKNVGALIKVNVAVDGITEIVFRGNNDEYVAGNVKVTVADEPTWKATTGYSRFVSLVAEEGQTLAQGNYYISVLPQTFTKGFAISAVHQDGTFSTNYVTKEVVLNRCDGIAGAFDANDTFGGSETKPYVLKTPEDLCSMYYLAIPEKEVYFELGGDIDMKDVTEWVAINAAAPCKKKTHLDGKGYTISNFSSPDQTYSSFFGVLYGSCRNITFKDAVITGSSSNGCGVLGGYVGTTNLPASVSNVRIDGAKITAATNYCGGIGGNTVASEFVDCSVTGLEIVSKFDYVGGIVGNAKDVCSFSKCSMGGKITGKQYVGGILGQDNGTSTITDCCSSCDINTTGQMAGGILGRSYSGTTTLNRCYSSGAIKGLRVTGGIAGSCISSILTIKDCIAWNPTVTSTNATSEAYYFSGAVRGGCNASSTLTSSGCWRRSDMELSAYSTNTLSESDDEASVKGAVKTAYHGKAAAADATLSSVATSLGWLSDTWDLTGNTPVLKAPVTE